MYENRKRRSKAAKRRWLIQVLHKRQRGRCVYCGVHMKLFAGHPPRSDSATLDHLIPYSLGGPTDLENTVAACLECNGEKQTLLPLEYIVWRLLTGRPYRERGWYHDESCQRQ